MHLKGQCPDLNLICQQRTFHVWAPNQNRPVSIGPNLGNRSFQLAVDKSKAASDSVYRFSIMSKMQVAFKRQSTLLIRSQGVIFGQQNRGSFLVV